MYKPAGMLRKSSKPVKPNTKRNEKKYSGYACPFCEYVKNI